MWVAGGGGGGGECGRVVGFVVAAACRGKGREREREKVNRNAICFSWVFMVVVLWVAGGGRGL